MGNTIQVSGQIHEIMLKLKRARPSEWIVRYPPTKRLRVSSFEENGAKAVNLPYKGVIIHVRDG